MNYRSKKGELDVVIFFLREKNIAGYFFLDDRGTEEVVRRREIYHIAIKPISPTVFWYFLESLIYFPGLSLQSVMFREADVYLQFLSKARGKLLH